VTVSEFTEQVGADAAEDVADAVDQADGDGFRVEPAEGVAVEDAVGVDVEEAEGVGVAGVVGSAPFVDAEAVAAASVDVDPLPASRFIPITMTAATRDATTRTTKPASNNRRRR
jgi:hypothetical protein